jgi:hypothetical protein
MEETKCYCGHTTYCDCGPETLEEAAEKTYKKLYEGEPLTQDVPIDAFKQGAKWQQDKNKYSGEEVLEIIYKFKQTCPYFIEEWFNKFKK